MKKSYVVLIAASIAPMLLVGCASVSDDIAKIAIKQGSSVSDDIARTATQQGSNVTDDAARQFSKNRTPVVPVTSESVNLNELRKKCTKQVGRSAVVKAWEKWKKPSFLNNQVLENDLLSVARDAIQKCTMGKVGDQVLDELANSVISEFKQKQLSTQ